MSCSPEQPSPRAVLEFRPVSAIVALIVSCASAWAVYICASNIYADSHNRTLVALELGCALWGIVGLTAAALLLRNAIWKTGISKWTGWSLMALGLAFLLFVVALFMMSDI